MTYLWDVHQELLPLERIVALGRGHPIEMSYLFYYTEQNAKHKFKGETLQIPEILD